MRKTIMTLSLLLLALPALASAADCAAPEPPMDLPDGATATKQEMIEGQSTVREYMQEAQDYVDCIDAAETEEMKKMMELSEGGREKKKAELVEARKNRNAVVTQMQRTADRFNQELDEYQTRQSGDS